MAQELRTADGCLSSEASEPFRFVNHYEQAERAMRAAQFHLPGRDLVSIMDREFDDVALERWSDDTANKHIIRAQHLDRKVLLRGRPTTLFGGASAGH